MELLDAMGAVLNAVSNHGLAVLLGGISGGLVGAAVSFCTWVMDARARTLRELFVQGMEIYKLREAYVADGGDFSSVELAKNRLTLELTAPDGTRCLRQVEVRAVLDPPTWNAPAQSDYGFIQGRRAWIVRNAAQQALSYGGPEGLDQPIRPALLSSQAMEELCGWIERVASVWPKWLFLSKHARHALWPLLVCVAGRDRIDVFGSRLSERAVQFLRWYHRKYRFRHVAQ